jgi:hypothetical protein
MKIHKRSFLQLMTGGMVAHGALGPLAAQAKPITGEAGTMIYENPLASASDVKDFILEGSAHVSFAEGRMVMENARPPEDGQDANFVHWCPEVFPRDIEISWDFTPLRLPGLCILFFGATGLAKDGSPISLFDPRLSLRAGRYEQYTSSDVSYLSLSYFRRRWEEEQRLHLVNLRAAPGFEMLAQGADPIPSEVGIGRTYAIRVRRKGPRVTMLIEDLPVLDWTAPDKCAVPGAGNIGLRQMAPLKAAYANLRVVAI